MDSLDFNKKLLRLMENCCAPVTGISATQAATSCGEQEYNHASYTQTKSIGDKSISITANAEDMSGIQEIIRLAGLESDHNVNVDVDIVDAGSDEIAADELGGVTDDDSDFDSDGPDSDFDSPSDYLPPSDKEVRESIKRKLAKEWQAYKK